MSTPDWTWPELEARLLTLFGCDDPNVGPEEGAPPRRMSEIADAMVEGAKPCRFRLFVLRESDIAALLGFQKVCAWLKSDARARDAFASWRAGGTR